jgi:hypothetical protein
MRRTSSAVLAVAALGLFPGEALAATINASPNPVHAGKRVRVFGHVGGGSGCQSGDRVTLISFAFSGAHEFAGVPAVFATVKANGHYSKRARIPKAKAPKKYAITARCGGGNFGVTRKLKVLAP